MSDERELYNCEHTIPSSPASTISLDEYIYGEDSPTPSLSSEMNEDVFFFTVKKWMQKRPRGPPKQAWTSPFFEKQAENKLKRSHSVNTTISLEAEGRHIPLQNHPLRNSKGNSGRYHIVVSNFSCLSLSLSGFNVNINETNHWLLNQW